MLRVYYFGCRGSEKGHFLHGADPNKTPRLRETLEGISFPIGLLDGTFTPIDSNDRSWRLTHLHTTGSHILSILACHDNTIDKRPGSNAAFVVVDYEPWTEKQILAEAQKRFPDCWERLQAVPRHDS